MLGSQREHVSRGGEYQGIQEWTKLQQMWVSLVQQDLPGPLPHSLHLALSATEEFPQVCLVQVAVNVAAQALAAVEE